MARGKHQTRAGGRRSAQQEATIAQLRHELESELMMLADAESAMAKVDQLQADLRGEKAATAEEIAPYAAALRSERDYLRTLYADAHAQHSRISEAWNRFAGAGIDVAPGRTNLEKVEAFGRELGVGGWMTSTDGDNLSTEQVTQIQRARGERREASDMSREAERLSSLKILLDLGQIGPALLPPIHRRKLIDEGIVSVREDGTHEIARSDDLSESQRGALDGAVSLAERIWKSRPGDLHSAVVHFWGSTPLVTLSAEVGAARRSFGEAPDSPKLDIPSSGLRQIGLPLASTPSSTRNLLATNGPERMLEAWRDIFDTRQRVARKLKLATHPFARVNSHPQPGQAVATQNLYALAAFSRWLEEESDSTLGRTAIGLTTAATYWLPAGQTASFAESDPVDASDRAEMALPFPQVFLAFAEPLILDPSITPTSSDRERWQALSEVSHDAYRGDTEAGILLTERIRDRGDDDWFVPDLDRLIEQVGAQIEGVLLLADSLGRPEDLFAWCLTLPGAYGSTLGRFVLPAARSTTEYRDVIDNLTAVVAWAQWHEPDASTDIPLGMSMDDVEALIATKEFQRDARRAGAGIRVVDVRTTLRAADGSGSVTHPGGVEAHISPHIRRGHWRRQRFGSGREQTKRIRIAPILVNAHRGDIAPRVYRLRPSRS